jgi:hypothetical protein
LSIQKDSTLSPQEKCKKIQDLMTRGYRTSQQQKPSVEDVAVTYHNSSSRILGCPHYMRKCKVLAPCCNQFFTCRFCHDEQVSEHKMNRYKVEEMFCMLCKERQSASQKCKNCGEVLGSYFCGVCHFWDDDPDKQIWHCEKCGLCRIGNRDNFEHCDICGLCMAAGHEYHIERIGHSNCPVCGEYLFNSVKPVFTPDPCHHPIHSHCFKELVKKFHFMCPLCQKTYSDVQVDWSKMDQIIEAHQMPEEYKDWKVEILCNDCTNRKVVPFHFLGHKCSCGSYNTKITHTYQPDGTEEANDNSE